MTYEDTFEKVFNKIPVWYTDDDGKDNEVIIQSSTKDGYAYVRFTNSGESIRVLTEELHE